MQLFHTSPSKIEAIKSTGRFGEFLFFSSKVYVMTAGEFVCYEIDLSDDELIDASELFFHKDASKLDELVAEFCCRFNVDADAAEEIIAERDQLESTDADDLWDAQSFTARAAKILGFRAVCVQDEQGAAYLVDMLGREAELKVVARDDE